MQFSHLSLILSALSCNIKQVTVFKLCCFNIFSFRRAPQFANPLCGFPLCIAHRLTAIGTVLHNNFRLLAIMAELQLHPDPQGHGSTGELIDRESLGEMNQTILMLEATERPKTFSETIRIFLKKHWFLIGLALVIVLAALWPYAGSKKGPLRTEYTVGYGITCMIFLLSGLSLKSKVLAQAIICWRLTVVVQVVSFGVTPIIGYGLAKILMAAQFDANLAAGIIICCCTPTTIASNVLMTTQAKGNEAAALVNAVIGNTLGVFASPLLIVGYLGASLGNQLNFGAIFAKLGLTVLVPLIVGQIIRYFWLKNVQWLQKQVNFGYCNSLLLLLLVWTVFCDTFLGDAISSVPVWQTVVVLVLDMCLFASFTAICYLLSQSLCFSRADTIAVVMCGATKTVALGIPLINVIFSNNPAIGVLAIPLLMYHALQLVAGSVLVSFILHHPARPV